MAEIKKFTPRKPRPLTATYQLMAPYVVERSDQDDGCIRYEVSNTRPGSYRFICATDDDEGENPYAKFDAEQIVRGLNMLVQYGLEALPAVRDDDQT